MSAGRLARERPYRVLLRQPAVRWQALAGLLAQVTQGASGVGIILVIRQHAGSLALAGGVVGAMSVAAAAARPLQGRLIDRRGAAGIMVGTGLGHAVVLAAIVSLAASSAPGVLLVVLGAGAGISLPPVSTAMRVGWGQRIGADERTAAYSLVYLVQELAILAGPLVLAAVTAGANASAAVIVIAVLTVLGAVWFAAFERAPAGGNSAEPLPAGSALRSREVRVLVLIAVLVGSVIGAFEVAAPTIAIAHGDPAASGLLIAALAVGGIIGAVGYAIGRFRFGPALRLVALLAWVMAAAVALAGSDTALLEVGALLLLCGLALNPVLTTISVLADRHTRGPTVAEAFGWLSTGLAGGTGAANAVAGAVTQRGGSARPAFLVAAAAAAAATATAAAARHRLGSTGRRSKETASAGTVP